MLIAIALVTVIGGVSLASASEGGNETTTAQARKGKCPNIGEGISFYKQSTWRWQTLRGVPKTKASKRQIASTACDYARYVAKLWQERSWTARVKYEEWLASRTLPYTNDWFDAVMISQRVFPGTAGWQINCSKHEGGHGGFVMNHQGSPAGGWMQFYASTYYAFERAAMDYVKSKGFIIHPKAWGWTQPMGQALVSGFMRKVLGNSYVHWKPSVDPYCI